MKYCPDCKIEKEITFFGKETGNRDGLRSICKKCNSARALKWHYNHLDHVNMRERELYKKDPTKSRVKNKKWRENNKDKITVKKREIWKNRDVEKTKKRLNEWCKNNKDKRRYSAKLDYEKHKEKRKPIRQAWEQNNKDKRSNMVANRRAAKLLATPPWLTNEDFLKIGKFYSLALQLTKETGIPHEVDHIHPLQGENFCGLHHWNNLQVLTKRLNRSKQNKIMTEIVGLFPKDL